jgi:hypothetical protein
MRAELRRVHSAQVTQVWQSRNQTSRKTFQTRRNDVSSWISPRKLIRIFERLGLPDDEDRAFLRGGWRVGIASTRVAGDPSACLSLSSRANRATLVPVCAEEGMGPDN